MHAIMLMPCRLHPEFEEHVGLALSSGCMQYVHLGSTGTQSIVLAQYMLMLENGERIACMRHSGGRATASMQAKDQA